MCVSVCVARHSLFRANIFNTLCACSVFGHGSYSQINAIKIRFLGSPSPVNGRPSCTTHDSTTAAAVHTRHDNNIVLYSNMAYHVILYCYARVEVLRMRTRCHRSRRSSSGPSARRWTFGFRTQRPAAAPREIKHTPSSADCIINTPHSPWR